MKRTTAIIYAICGAMSAATLCGCTDSTPVVSLGLDESYIVPRMTKLPLQPALTGAKYLWKVNGEPVSTQRTYIFLAADEGRYDVSFEIIDPESPYHHEMTVNVVHEEVEYTPYIAHAYEYNPAPGQFVNEMPRYEPGDTYADMLQKVEESISGTNDVMVSLGGYGGYVTFGFDHTVVNVAGERDLRIWGNAFYELTQPGGPKGGSAEPGIVAVSYDANCNGVPDDAWYELAGSEYRRPDTDHAYSITYHRPDPDRTIESGGNGSLSDIYYIAWDDSRGDSGYMPKNIFHRQEYYPQWVDSPTLSFSGSLLPPNGVDTSGNSSYFILYCYGEGYVDNHPNDAVEYNTFDIAWVVDREGNHVDLPGVDFVRVYTGVNQYCGWLGETSTEICRAADLHIDIKQ